MGSWWQELWWGIRDDWTDLPGPAEAARVVLRCLLAALLGGLLGYERESSGKAAGLRTHMLVALGAALFVLIPSQAGMPLTDLSRVLQGVIAGMGFLCAGVIMKDSEHGAIHGLTTAAGLWLTAAIGIAVGTGRLASALVATLLAFVILALVPRLPGAPPGSAGRSGNHGEQPTGHSPGEG